MDDNREEKIKMRDTFRDLAKLFDKNMKLEDEIKSLTEEETKKQERLVKRYEKVVETICEKLDYLVALEEE
ncbi:MULTISPECIES: hypothetical protein [unclassified Clostridioides]|uniref:hypothetical protein n=1 Tax=unclassified Clostridioides TaxID=2635829 RepID=UPI001D0CAB9E|nr:hypothetical protein [Clostridioides sp. ES-S-0049-03]MCC0647884.1 hypothetical protein [Clostridioides sp. ZZV15-6598]MCC0762220.1 hypothetical protein [Clostridioides sp. ES-S-0006-03]MCE4722118.1 hypothetical protein [Clostridioides difficile]